MGRYSEVKIFRPQCEIARRNLFVSTHAKFAVDLFGTTDSSTDLRSMPSAAGTCTAYREQPQRVVSVKTLSNGTDPGLGFPFCIEARAIIKRLLCSHSSGRKSRV
jgi:hypothetical protein